MSQKISKGSIFGRIGSGFAKGLSEQVPKEIERNRLASGLQQLEQDAPNLSLSQRFSRALTIPGFIDRPQAIQSLGDLYRQESYNKSFGRNADAQGISNGTPQFKENQNPEEAEDYASIARRDLNEAMQKPYIEPSKSQDVSRANELFNRNPAGFGNDIRNAEKYVSEENTKNRQASADVTNEQGKLTAIEEGVKTSLRNEQNIYGPNLIPEDVYKKVENDAIDAVKSRPGKKGMTEQQAIQHFHKDLKEIAKDYQDIKSIGKWSFLTGRPKSVLRALENTRNSFDAREDDNMAQKIMGATGSGPETAYAISDPVKKVPEANNYLKKLPSYKGIKVPGGAYRAESNLESPTDRRNKTLEISKDLGKLLKKNKELSPQAIAHELRKKNYDVDTFLDYINNNQKELDLAPSQTDQLKRQEGGLMGALNDWWFSSWTGIE